MRRRRQQAVTTFLLIFFVVAVYSALGAELAAYSVQSLLELFYVQYIIYIIYFIYTYYNTSTNVYYILYLYLVFLAHTTYLQVVLVVFHHHYGPKNELQWNYNELAIYTFKVESENHWGCNMCLWKSSVISNVVVVVAASMKRERDPIFQGQGRFILGSLCYLL